MAEAAALKPAAKPIEPQWGAGGMQRPKLKEVKFAGIVVEFKEITTKKGSRMAFLQVEDLEGRLEVVVFPKPYAELTEIIGLAKDAPEPMLITGELDMKDGEVKILATKIEKLEDAHSGRVVTVMVELDPTRIAIEQLRTFKQFILQNRGKSQIRVRFQASDWKANMELPSQLKVEGTPQFAAGVNKIFGQIVARLL